MIPVDMSTTPSQEPAHSGIGVGAATASWRDHVHRGLASNATPVVLFPDRVRSAASLWSGVRTWTHHLRRANIGARALVLAALPAGEALLQLLVACLWEGVCLEVHPPLGDGGALRRRLEGHDGALLVLEALPESAPAWMHAPAPGGWPDEDRPFTCRLPLAGQAERPEEPFVRMGDESGLTHAQLLHRFTEQLRDAPLHGTRVLSLADWHDMHELLDGVIAPLLSAEELFVADAGDLEYVAQLLRDEPISHAVLGGRCDPLVRALFARHPEVVLRFG